FEWRDDETGAMMARALLAAADRGVQVTVLKDLVGATYEYYEGSRQSFFHKSIDWRTRLEALGLMTAYGALPWLSARSNALAETLLAHPNIRVEHDRRRFDHAKVYLIDDDILFVGGIGLGDASRLASLDFMVEIAGTGLVARDHARVSGTADFDRSRPIDFLLHNAAVNGHEPCPLAVERLRMIREAR